MSHLKIGFGSRMLQSFAAFSDGPSQVPFCTFCMRSVVTAYRLPADPPIASPISQVSPNQVATVGVQQISD